MPKISGFGMTLNFAHGRAWLILGAMVALPLAGGAVAVVSAFWR